MLITSTGNGGNLILNVGPTARGEFDYRATNALDSISHWMYANSQSIYGCTYAPDAFRCPPGEKLTYNPSTKKLYVHLFDYPASGVLTLPGYKGLVRYALFLHDQSELPMKEDGKDISLKLPVKKPGYEIPVVELILN